MNKWTSKFFGVSAADRAADAQRERNELYSKRADEAAEKPPEPPSAINPLVLKGGPSESDILELEQHCRVEASHQLPFHDGKCKELHGHSYDIQVKLEYSTRYIPAHNFVIDFGKIKDVCEQFDHTYLNTHRLFEGKYPTVENFCIVIEKELYEYVMYKTDAFADKITVRIREGLGSHWATLTKHYR